MIQKNIETNKKMISCSQSELFYLSEKDPILGEAIRKIGAIERTFYPDFYEGFANAIIGQQISTKAMETVWSRLMEVCKIITPQSILDTDYDVLKTCGISGRKIDYLIQCARKIQDGTLQVEVLNQKSDDEVEKILTSLSGVGKWTAEMLLIFTFGRSNILSFGDNDSPPEKTFFRVFLFVSTICPKKLSKFWKINLKAFSHKSGKLCYNHSYG